MVAKGLIEGAEQPPVSDGATPMTECIEGRPERSSEDPAQAWHSPRAADLLAKCLQDDLGTLASDVARRALQRFGSIAAVLAAGRLDLQTVSGMHESAAQRISLVYELCLAAAREKLPERVILSAPCVAHEYIRTTLAHRPVEHVLLLLLDMKDRVISDEIIGVGTINHAPLYPREVVKRAIVANAAGAIIAHNHPSGSANPSKKDIEAAHEIRSALYSVDVVLHDFVIVGEDGITSLIR